MDIKLVNPSINYDEIRKILKDSSDRDVVLQGLFKFSRDCARICYTEKDFDEVMKEPYNQELVFDRLLPSGHHSVFEHINFSFSLSGYPKIMAMIFNNEKQYATSEKSARFTQMQEAEPEQRKKYEKWMEILQPEIAKIYPNIPEGRDTAITKLGQENARYMTSVFTPTKWVYTTNWRQLNFLMQSFGEFEEGLQHCDATLAERIVPWMQSFSEQASALRVDGMDNQTDRHLSLFNPRLVEEHFGDTYSTSYRMSFAGLAQAHRHRTINYHISDGTTLGGPLGFFIPGIIKDNPELVAEWIEDLTEVASSDFPQAQLLRVNERGIIEDFRSKALLRMCGHAQYEIMRQTLETAGKYEQYQAEYSDGLKTKCLQGIDCNSKCNWRGARALERRV